jgi:hypothetical protein
VLCVYKEVGTLNDTPDINRASATISYDEKSGIQALKNIVPQRHRFLANIHISDEIMNTSDWEHYRFWLE